MQVPLHHRLSVFPLFMRQGVKKAAPRSESGCAVALFGFLGVGGCGGRFFLRLAEDAVPENASAERQEFLAIVREATILK
jgi:hypothetical protein